MPTITLGELACGLMGMKAPDRAVDRAVEVALKAHDSGGDTTEALFGTWALEAIPPYTGKTAAVRRRAAKDGVRVASVRMPFGYQGTAEWGDGSVEVAYAMTEACAELAAYLLAKRRVV